MRKIIRIDGEKCNGCGLCVKACHEGAIGIRENRAILLRDDYCDGLGDCLPACPTGAISFEYREAAPYDEAAVLERKKLPAADEKTEPVRMPGGCPGSRMRTDCQWPVQLRLVPEQAPYFQDADLLAAADCTAFAAPGAYEQIAKGKAVVVGCPKLDPVDMVPKLTAILSRNSIKSVTVLRMEVPCCGGIERAVSEALRQSESRIPMRVLVLSAQGKVIREEQR